ncbi:MAG: metal-sulfur cluster assembly factor [Isosphaeraceae bacterium]
MPGIRYRDHTDSVEQKLKLLEAAVGDGRRDVALSLAESIRDTLRFERSTETADQPVSLASDQSVPVSTLPRPWAEWAKGWSHARPFALLETVTLERIREPVEMTMAIAADQATDPNRELRLARVDAQDGSLREIPSQVTRVTREGGRWRCGLVFLADVPAHGQADYLVFHGNPYAELPEYVTDLRTRGEGYALEISNHHFRAQLSPQMGQLDRLTFRREHGHELYAGGKGHGEPPSIDWAHDYVDEGNFQKVRIKNWERCPNFEVEVGPILVRIRRWGFPHSPLHPLFTPSRIHVDQTYSFFAGQPHFFKQGRMEAIQDVTVEAMRDDEWVFSGYSFTDLLWIDRAGKLHEGPVPAESINDLWGVGFRHRDSRDAFLALWLEHRAEGHDSIGNNGTPTLQYPGHGQLWSRYPLHHAKLKAGATFHQRNAYLVLAYPEHDAAKSIEAIRHRLVNPLVVQAGGPSRPANATAAGALARPGETAGTAPLKPAIWQALKQVMDDQLYTTEAGIVDLGYVYDVRVRGGTAHVIVTMPHRGRPVHDFLVTQGGGRVTEGIRERLLRIEGVRDVVVDVAWNPPWNVARLTDVGRRALGLG